MPELPEVETMRRGVAPIVGCRIVAVPSVRCAKKPIHISPALPQLRRRVVGQTVVEVGRIGKRLMIRLDRGESIVVEPRMTGLALIADPPNREHLRFEMRLSAGSEKDARGLQFLFWDRRGLGSVRLLTADECARRFGSDRVGPDALSTSAEILCQRLGSSRRAVKVALLDQRAVAGVGNLYASEILHLAHIHPAQRCATLRGADWQRLHAALEEVLHTAILHEGSTLSDGTYRNALNQSGGYQNHHRVYDRAGEACPSCGKGSIVRVVQAQRSTFFCGRCQPLRRARGAKSRPIKVAVGG